MSKRLIFLLLFPFMLFANTLVLQNGSINALTSVFGDGTIDPSVKKISTNLSMEDSNITTMQGDISFNLVDFISSNSDRDEHMQEMFESSKYTAISFHIDAITKTSDAYTIKGVMDMHGVKKEIEVPAKITTNGATLTIQANFVVKVSDYGMETPSLFFLSVKDDVAINSTLTFGVTQ